MPLPPTTQIDPIKIFYPNGGNTASQMYVWDTGSSQPVLWTGAATFSGTLTIGAVAGSLSNNTAAPAANNIGVLPAVVSTTDLGYTQGRQVLLRVDTTGALVIAGSFSTAGLATFAAQTDGSQLTQIVNTTGTTIGVSTTAPIFVTGLVTTTISNTTMTVVQPTGTNLHAVIDSGNINSTVTGAVTATVTGSVTATISNTTMTVVQPTGTNLHVVVDSGNINSTVSGTVTVNGTLTSAVVLGTLTNNNAAPAANNVGVLPAIVSTTASGYTDGRQVLLRLNTTGELITVVNSALPTGGNLIGLVGKKFTYASSTALTTTNWLGLTSGSGWQSASIATGGASEIQFLLTTLGAAGSTLLGDFYLAESFAAGNFTDGATGTEGTFTAANRKNSRFVGSLQFNTTASVTGMVKYTDVSGSLPERVVLIGINNSGGTVSTVAGNTVFSYELIN